MGGDQHADINFDRGSATHPLDLALFEHAQELGLHGRGHVADLIEKQRAALGLLEFAEVARCRSGERSLFVPK